MSKASRHRGMAEVRTGCLRWHMYISVSSKKRHSTTFSD